MRWTSSTKENIMETLVLTTAVPPLQPYICLPLRSTTSQLCLLHVKPSERIYKDSLWTFGHLMSFNNTGWVTCQSSQHYCSFVYVLMFMIMVADIDVANAVKFHLGLFLAVWGSTLIYPWSLHQKQSLVKTGLEKWLQLLTGLRFHKHKIRQTVIFVLVIVWTLQWFSFMFPLVNVFYYLV